MTNQVISEAEETQPLHQIQNGRNSNEAVKVPENGVKDDSRREFSSSEEEREISALVPEMDAEEAVIWEEEETEVPNRKGIRWPAVLAGVGIGVAATLAGVYLVSGKSAGPAATVPAPQAPTSQTVTVALVESVEVAQALEATGTVAAYDLLPVLPQANGLQIKQVLVAEGDRVEKGQVMAVLDDSVLRSQIAEAVAKVQSADSTVEQAQAQVQQAQSAQQEAQAGVDGAQAGVEKAIADVAQAKTGVGQAKAGVEQAKAGVEQARAGIASAQAKLDQAQREVNRTQDLASQGVISQQDLEKRKTERLTAVQDLNKTKADLNKALEEQNKAAEEVRSAVAKVATAEANISTARAALSSARAKVNTAASSVSSARANVGNNAAGVRSNDAQVKKLQIQLEQTVVRAPDGGTVAERIGRVGDVSAGSQKLFSIIRGNKLELQLKVPETQLSQVRPGTAVNISSDSDRRIKLAGTVRDISPLVDPQNRQATVKIDLPQSEFLRSGMFLRGSISTATTQGLKVPAKAILPQSDGGALVYKLVGEDKVLAQPVQVGEISGGAVGDLTDAKVEVKKGLKVGDRVVVDGAGYLKDGDRVKVVK
ncbi:MAG: efflux RND transporter periplasmic adaptor subunit [Tychonema bourrellyi B0820]|uniref:Efflux RND transporter periplasmic adaptor subunit n=1 Tax=Tychonema bourrellyi FEM_GT703 TaxID=2040638 RepID=A0A2G4EXZ8_9CYAN|nr:efflux RND transporter periplasmic adaptor subunit [Tychonema bourrellyi]MDQ2098606.1 efflux RND transporter periplasmic adaptor subunit [Tychonema bourrellyi B0820]PHX54415.1 efflux RND transporter periplasmic adaptor subunit [Tychonema bourrellyi FEM_GT703]